jgi:hypothetical protein
VIVKNEMNMKSSRGFNWVGLMKIEEHRLVKVMKSRHFAAPVFPGGLNVSSARFSQAVSFIPQVHALRQVQKER